MSISTSQVFTIRCNAPGCIVSSNTSAPDSADYHAAKKCFERHGWVVSNGIIGPVKDLCPLHAPVKTESIIRKVSILHHPLLGNSSASRLVMEIAYEIPPLIRYVRGTLERTLDEDRFKWAITEGWPVIESAVLESELPPAAVALAYRLSRVL